MKYLDQSLIRKIELPGLRYGDKVNISIFDDAKNVEIARLRVVRFAEEMDRGCPSKLDRGLNDVHTYND